MEPNMMFEVIREPGDGGGSGGGDNGGGTSEPCKSVGIPVFGCFAYGL